MEIGIVAMVIIAFALGVVAGMLACICAWILSQSPENTNIEETHEEQFR